MIQRAPLRGFSKKMKNKVVPAKSAFAIDEFGHGQKKLAGAGIDTGGPEVVARAVHDDFGNLRLKSGH
jgi:hypothetical protein